MEDLTGIYEQFGSDRITALAPTSQAGGNMMSSNRLAMTSPGSPPVDPLPPAKDQGEPDVENSPGPRIQPGDDGKPEARTTAGKPSLPEPAWKTTS